MKLSVIIPAYNEEKRISKTLLSIDRFLERKDYDYEIIVVSDGSKDKTAEKVNNLKSTVENLRIIDNKENHGKGWVVAEGMLKASGEVRLFMDADNSTTIEHIDKFWKYFDEGYNVVIGSRDLPESEVAVPQAWYKTFLGNFGNKIIQLVAVWGIRDTQCGFKAFSAKAAEDIFSRQRIFRWGFDVEALALARRLGYKIKEAPIKWINDPESKVSFKSYFQVFKEVFQIRWWLITKKYETKTRASKISG